jgi:general secretion pathway protein E
MGSIMGEPGRAEASAAVAALSMPSGSAPTIPDPSAEFLARVPPEFAREHLVLSAGQAPEGRELLLVSGRASDPVVAHNLAVVLGRPCALRLVPHETIAAAIDDLVATGAFRPVVAPDGDSSALGALGPDEAGDDAEMLGEADLAQLAAAGERDLLSAAGRGPIVKLVNGILFEALRRRASDVHTHLRGPDMVVRYRIDGVLEDARCLPAKLLIPLVSRVKVMARMDIAERRLPQDGRATVTIGPSGDAREIDLRVSTIPTACGERLVIRLLDKRNVEFFRLDRLGMPANIQDRFARSCGRSHGMVLVTGPTGSGKTTTLYSVLRTLNTSELNVMTLEDPIEYELAGISQSQINARKGVTFATGLRHVLRQDPDVIMVGEVRDAETARMAIQASLTGHMVFSTLHTNSAATAVTRLTDLGVEPYLINASLSAVLAQRLVRRMRPDGSGCSGRIGLFELLVMDNEIRSLVASGADASAIELAAKRAGMRTLREAGLALLSAGETTREEIDRVTLIDDEPDSPAADAAEPGGQ